MRVELVHELLRAENPLDPVFRVLSQEIWSATSFREHSQAGTLDQYLTHNEHVASELERQVYDVYDDLYREIEEPQAGTDRVQQLLSGSQYTLVVFDGLSLREMPALLETIIGAGLAPTASYVVAPVPSETDEFAKRHFNATGPAQIEGTLRDFVYRYVKRDDWQPDFAANQRKRVIWVLYPDNVFRLDSEAVDYRRYVVEPVQRILSATIAADPVFPLVVTSDHGYLWQGGSAPWALGEEEARLLAKHFKAGRSTDEATSALIHTRKVWISGTRAAARGRFAWGGAVKGATRLFKHGGVSFMECIVPWVQVRR